MIVKGKTQVQQNVDQKPRQEAYSIKPPGQVYRDTKTQPNDRSNRVELQAYQEVKIKNENFTKISFLF